MSKYHISKLGVPAVCKAKEGNCPLGDNSQHFETVEEAQTYVDQVNIKEYEMLPVINNAEITETRPEVLFHRYLLFYDEVLKCTNFEEFTANNAKDIVKSGIFKKSTIYEDTLKMWKDIHYYNSAQHLYKMNEEDAINTVSKFIRPNAISGWFRNYDSNYKPEIEQAMITNPSLRNAGINIAHRVYQETTDEDINFQDFINSNITVYRGGNFNFIEDDVFISYSFDKKVADQFAGSKYNTEQKVIKIKDTLGSLQTTGEAEIMVRR